jgi:tRNA(fMet)-specific endonuclease VapC
MNGRPPAVRVRLAQSLERGEHVTVSSIAVFELWHGVAKSGRIAYNTERLLTFLGRLTTLSFDEEDARVAGQVRANLGRIGRPIGSYDFLIAGHALHRDFLLVTANVREFARVQGLRWEDWTRPS